MKAKFRDWLYERQRRRWRKEGCCRYCGGLVGRFKRSTHSFRMSGLCDDCEKTIWLLATAIRDTEFQDIVYKLFQPVLKIDPDLSIRVRKDPDHDRMELMLEMVKMGRKQGRAILISKPKGGADEEGS